MKIRDLFRRDIYRTIPEVIKVDDEAGIADEINEYVVTDHILDEMETVFESYYETIKNASVGTNVSTTPITGGLSKPMISIARQLVISERLGVCDRSVGKLVTMDSAYDLFESFLLSADYISAIADVASKYGNKSIETKAAKVVALLGIVRDLPLTLENISVLLRPSIRAEPVLSDVFEALERLTADGCLWNVDGRYRFSAASP